MAAFGRYYAGDFTGSLQEAEAAIKAAMEVQHKRAAIIGHHAAYVALLAQGKLAEVRRHADDALALSRELGALRFEGESLGMVALADGLLGDKTAALRAVREAIQISRTSGFSYFGPVLLGMLALITDDDAERQAAYDEAERLLTAGCVSHNHLMFYESGSEASLKTGDLDRALRYLDALDAYCRVEPSPWSTFVIARGRALAAWQQGEPTIEVQTRLLELAAEARRIGHLLALAAIERAIRHAGRTIPPNRPT